MQPPDAFVAIAFFSFNMLTANRRFDTIHTWICDQKFNTEIF